MTIPRTPRFPTGYYKENSISSTSENGAIHTTLSTTTSASMASISPKPVSEHFQATTAPSLPGTFPAHPQTPFTFFGPAPNNSQVPVSPFHYGPVPITSQVPATPFHYGPIYSQPQNTPFYSPHHHFTTLNFQPNFITPNHQPNLQPHFTTPHYQSHFTTPNHQPNFTTTNQNTIQQTTTATPMIENDSAERFISTLNKSSRLTKTPCHN
jgi:hypothetical protein